MSVGPNKRVSLDHAEAAIVTLPSGAVVEVIVGLDGRFRVNVANVSGRYVRSADGGFADDYESE